MLALQDSKPSVGEKFIFVILRKKSSGGLEAWWYMVGVTRGGGGEEDGRVYQGVVWTSDLRVVCGMNF